MKSKRILDRAGIDLSSLDSSRLRADYAAMEKEKTALQNSYKAASKELMTMEQNLRKNLPVSSKGSVSGRTGSRDIR